MWQEISKFCYKEHFKVSKFWTMFTWLNLKFEACANLCYFPTTSNMDASKIAKKRLKNNHLALLNPKQTP